VKVRSETKAVSKQVLAKLIKTGYPYMKEGSGLPSWLLPESSLTGTVEALGDDGILKISRSLSLDKGLGNPSYPSLSLSPEEWQDAVNNWPNLPKVKPFISAFMEAVSKMTSHLENGIPGVPPMKIYRSLAVIGFAPFIPEGKPIIEELSKILDRQACMPAELLTRYTEAVVNDDITTIEKVNECIVKYDSWARWADRLQKLVGTLTYKPRLIAVTPPLTDDLVSVLASVVKERQKDGPGRDYPKYSGS